MLVRINTLIIGEFFKVYWGREKKEIKYFFLYLDVMRSKTHFQIRRRTYTDPWNVRYTDLVLDTGRCCSGLKHVYIYLVPIQLWNTVTLDPATNWINVNQPLWKLDEWRLKLQLFWMEFINHFVILNKGQII